MKILWVKSDFLHPTTKGGHIRTLETLKRLHQRNEIHYVALDLPEQRGGVERSSKYCTKAYPIPHSLPARNSTGYFMQAFGGLFSYVPVSVSRYRSDGMRRQVETLRRSEKFDAIVCDFLFPAVNMPDLSGCVLFQHNVEAMIWKRNADTQSNSMLRKYFGGQYERMLRFEGEVCRAVKSIIAVSEIDGATMREKYGVSRIAAVPTGVDVEYFAPENRPSPAADFVFVGSMDWMPNIDGVDWFVDEILPLIRKKRPECSLAVVGRTPDAGIQQLARNDNGIRVTGTVPDVRPYLWGSAVSIVPLRIGGGTRLKIYEAMAAKIPVVSTTIGAEGLDVRDGDNIYIADTPAEFADRCLTLLESEDARRRMADTAFDMVSSRYSWEVVSREFEKLLL
jgi:polysaccharide biosynthesis protein PslH